MNELLKLVKETVERFGIHFEFAVMVRPTPPPPPTYGPLMDDVVEVGDKEN